MTEDYDMQEEGLYDLYLNYCKQNQQKPSIKDYIVWLQENYD